MHNDEPTVDRNWQNNIIPERWRQKRPMLLGFLVMLHEVDTIFMLFWESLYTDPTEQWEEESNWVPAAFGISETSVPLLELEVQNQSAAVLWNTMGLNKWLKTV